MRIAYVVPTPAQPSFIYNEMIEVQGAGHDLVIVPLHSSSPSPVFHRVSNHLKPEKVLPAGLCNTAIFFLSLYMLLGHPIRVLRALISLHYAAGLNPFAHAGILAVTPKALATAYWLRGYRVDRIHAHFASHTATCAGIAGIVSGIPFSFTAHAYDIYCTALSLRNDTLGWKLRHAAQVFAISEHGKNLLCATLPLAARGHIHKIFVGIPMDVFQERVPPPLDSNGPRLLCVARFDTKKGLDTLLDACAILKEQSVPFQLRIYGDGPLRQSLTEQVTKLSLKEHVQLGLSIPQEAVAEELGACHMFVMPCRMDQKTGDIDGIPTVFMEAMATGRPVISCAVAGIPELVRDGETGLLVPPDDPIALAKAIVTLGCNDSLRLRLGKQAKVLVEQQHNQRTNTRQFLDLLTSEGAGVS